MNHPPRSDRRHRKHLAAPTPRGTDEVKHLRLRRFFERSREKAVCVLKGIGPDGPAHPRPAGIERVSPIEVGRPRKVCLVPLKNNWHGSRCAAAQFL